MVSDDALAGARRSDPEALRELVLAHERAVYGLLVRLVGSTDAEDLAQETFLRAFQALPRFRREASAVRPWLLTIATRAGIDALRKRRRTDLLLEEHLADAAPSPEHDSDQHALARRLHLVLSEESADGRAAFLLHAYHGMTDREIGEVLRCKPATVRSRLRRTKERLRHRLRDLRPTGAFASGENS